MRRLTDQGRLGRRDESHALYLRIIANLLSESYSAKVLTLRENKEEVMRRLVIALSLCTFLSPGMSLAQQAAPSMQGEFARGVASPVLSVVYFPVKLAVGITGALLGGISGWATGGNQRAAEGIWVPMTGGSYFITPETLDGTKPFLPFDGGPYAPPAPTPAPSGSMSYQP
jgi:hypothetical protein